MAVTAKPLFLLGLAGGVILAWYAVLTRHPGELRVAFLDIGQGDAIFIETPSGTQILVDGGSGQTVLSKLGTLMPAWDRSIDMVVSTHPDRDHIEGLLSVLERYRVTSILVSGVAADTRFDDEFERLSEAEGAKRYVARRDMVFKLDRDTFLTVLFPDRDAARFETNTASIVAKLSYGSTAFLLTGDSPTSIEDYLVQLDDHNPNDELRSDVLKAGHHGSRTSTGDAFLAEVAPDVAVISAGRDNRYGHPHEETISRLQMSGVSIVSTAKEGTIVIASDGRNVWKE